MPKQAAIFLNGTYADDEPRVSQIDSSALIIGVDGGTKYLLTVKRVPNVVIGDLDSLTEADRELIIQKGYKIIQYTTRKDETDFELAINHAVSQGCDQILIFGGLFGRIDHMLANLLLPTSLGSLDIRFIYGTDEIFYIHESAAIHGQRGDTISLLPLNRLVTGVQTHGLEYPLDNETLYPGKSRGVSNIMKSTLAEVSISTGLLLCIHLTNSTSYLPARS